jgi:uncharacterized protein (TIGR02284 family)
MNTSHDTTVLNTLIATTLDSVKGFKEAAEHSEDAAHRQFFTEMSQERSRVAADLQQQVRASGGDPETESSTAGAVHRGWADLKAAIAGRDEKAIVNEVERGEDYIKAKFETAMHDDELSAQARVAVEQCLGSIRKGHDRASAMKHAMH